MFPVVSERIEKVPDLPDWSNCRHQVVLLQDDGIWLSPYMKTTLNELDAVGDWTADCRLDGEGTVGGPSEAKTASINEYKTFFKRAFYLP